MTSSITFTVGRLLCRPIRDYLKRRKFIGMDIEWIESRGLFEREFTVKGDPYEISLIANSVAKWARGN